MYLLILFGLLSIIFMIFKFFKNINKNCVCTEHGHIAIFLLLLVSINLFIEGNKLIIPL